MSRNSIAHRQLHPGVIPTGRRQRRRQGRRFSPRECAAIARRTARASTLPRYKDSDRAAVDPTAWRKATAVGVVESKNGESKSPYRQTLPVGDLPAVSSETATSYHPLYQGMPFKFGACAACSGRLPVKCINAMTSTPAHPPPINAANTHQNETIGSPPSYWPSWLPGKLRPGCADRFAPRRGAIEAVVVDNVFCGA
jgi:hypothetical protein